jgi:hypothetical protein
MPTQRITNPLRVNLNYVIFMFSSCYLLCYPPMLSSEMKTSPFFIIPENFSHAISPVSEICSGEHMLAGVPNLVRLSF